MREEPAEGLAGGKTKSKIRYRKNRALRATTVDLSARTHVPPLRPPSRPPTSPLVLRLPSPFPSFV